MTKRRWLMLGGCFLAVIAIGSCWVVYSLSHLSIDVSPSQTEAMVTAFKGTLGEAIFNRTGKSLGEGKLAEGTDLNALLVASASSQPPDGKGLIADYQADPKKFKRYAQLLDTALNARAIGKSVWASKASYTLPLLSTILPIPEIEKVDAWGHPYCISAFRSNLVVISGGPNATSFSCGKQVLQAGEIEAAQRSIFQARSGEVVVVVTQSEINQ